MNRCVVALALAGLLACAASGPRIERDPTFDFDALRTWEWSRDGVVLETADPRLASDALHGAMREAIEQGLAARGLRPLESGADVVVSYQLGVETQREVEAEPIERPAGDDVFLGPPRVEVREREYGRLAITLSRPGAEHPVWRGSVRAPIHHAQAVEARDRAIRHAVRELLAALSPAPPRAGRGDPAAP